MADMRTLVVVGNGMVGHRLVQAVRERDHDGRWRVVVFAEEARPAYDRVALSSYVDTWDPVALQLEVAEFDGDGRVELHLGEPVLRIDRDTKTVHTGRR